MARQQRTEAEQAQVDTRMGRRDAAQGQAYTNPYRADTPSFTDYETGYFEAKEVVLKWRGKR